MTDVVWHLISTEWTPGSLTLGTLHEGDSFSFTISCDATYESDPDPVTLLVDTKVEACTITVVPELIRASVTINGGVIAGSLIDVFARSIRYMNKDRTYTVVDGYSQIDQDNLFKLISVQPSNSSEATFHFTCTAVEADESRVYAIVVRNDWTSDKNSLQAFVAQTNALSVGDLTS